MYTVLGIQIVEKIKKGKRSTILKDMPVLNTKFGLIFLQLIITIIFGRILKFK